MNHSKAYSAYIYTIINGNNTYIGRCEISVYLEQEAVWQSEFFLIENCSNVALAFLHNVFKS